MLTRPGVVEPVSLLLVALIGALDRLTGFEIAFSAFYLIPVALMAWHSGRAGTVVVSLLSAVAWLWADITAGRHYTHPAIPYLNGVVRLVTFLVAGLTLAALRRAMLYARTDYVTGLANGRRFYDLLQAEIHRQRRYSHPFTVAYLDLDDFKAVNDRFGHSTGDQLLRSVAAVLDKRTRSTDAAARIGGDEFAVLLPETDGTAARVVLTAIGEALQAVVPAGQVPVTASIGAVTFEACPKSVEEILRTVDAAMYAAKHAGKNRTSYETIR
jgi:diguanylate cyclase (GGDEF)-like protein